MRRDVKGAQNVSRMCIVCGVENRFGLRGRFYTVDGGELVGVFQPQVEHQGYPGRMHGGMVSAILDETIGRITRDSRRLFEGTGEIVLEDGTVAAEAQGKYMKMAVDEIASQDFSDNEWFADSRPLPAGIDVGEGL